MAPAAVHDAGVLPLLSYALLAAWERAGRKKITVADYLAVGGVRGAVRQAAESLYGALSDRGASPGVRAPGGNTGRMSMLRAGWCSDGFQVRVRRGVGVG